MSLEPPRRKSKAHIRTVTRFCEEANITENDQLDLAEFILAAHYLGSEASDDQLMDIFMGVESKDEHNKKNPKELIRELMTKVNEQYGKGTTPTTDDKENEEEHEVVILSKQGKEDTKWQEIHLDSFLNSTANDQTLKIAKNLLQTTALTRLEIAQLTGIDPKLLENNEEEEEESDEEEEESQDVKQIENEKIKQNNDSAVVIQANDFSKSLVITKSDVSILDELVKGGAQTVRERGEVALSLLVKLQQAIDISPFGVKRKKIAKTRSKGNVQQSLTEFSQLHEISKSNNLQLPSDDNVLKAPETNVSINTNSVPKLPAKYRVVINPGALVKQAEDLKSNEVGKLAFGAVVTVEEISERRARISAPIQGWCSLYAKDGRVILQKESTKSKEMEEAIAAERTHQTKIAILKSITTLNDATVVRILEKSEWNLRRAIEAFYIAKFKTQEYLKQTQGTEPAANSNSNLASPSDTQSPKPNNLPRKSKGWWKSWKEYASQN